MGTSGAYTGAGGKAGKDIGSGLNDWLDSLPDGWASDGSAPTDDETDAENEQVTQLPPQAVSGLLSLLRPREAGGGSGDGPVGGGRASGGMGRTRAGSGRSSRRLASVGGRAAAGAFAYIRGDAEELAGLGLDYGELRALDDDFEVARRIVDAVCGKQSNGRLEEAEERYVAASVTEWVLSQSENGDLLDVDGIARYAIATIVTEVLSSELGEAMRNRPDDVSDVPEDELRAAASVLARRADLGASGPTAEELTAAIEQGVESLRPIYGIVP